MNCSANYYILLWCCNTNMSQNYKHIQQYISIFIKTSPTSTTTPPNASKLKPKQLQNAPSNATVCKLLQTNIVTTKIIS